MTPALVHCAACEREWHSVTMAENLRALESCPRCGGTLVFADGAPPAAPPTPPTPPAAGQPGTAPHLVLGLPRR